MVFVELDGKGRFVMPKSVRAEVDSSKFEVLVADDHRVILVPVLPLEKLRGAFKTGAKKLERYHDLEKTYFP